jgi:hypothetical protein
MSFSAQDAGEIARLRQDIVTTRLAVRTVREEWALARIQQSALALKSELAAFRFRIALGRHALAQKAGFKRDQPRWSRGNGDISGRWSGGAGTGPSTSSTIRAPTRGGHHFVSKEVYGKLPLRPETRQVFDEAITGRLHYERHAWSKEHAIYNEAIKEKLAHFSQENGIRLEDMTPDQARKFVDEVKRSYDPRIRRLNLRIYTWEILYWMRRVSRGNE